MQLIPEPTITLTLTMRRVLVLLRIHAPVPVSKTFPTRLPVHIKHAMAGAVQHNSVGVHTQIYVCSGMIMSWVDDDNRIASNGHTKNHLEPHRTAHNRLYDCCSKMDVCLEFVLNTSNCVSATAVLFCC